MVDAVRKDQPTDGKDGVSAPDARAPEPLDLKFFSILGLTGSGIQDDNHHGAACTPQRYPFPAVRASGPAGTPQPGNTETAAGDQVRGVVSEIIVGGSATKQPTETTSPTPIEAARDDSGAVVEQAAQVVTQLGGAAIAAIPLERSDKRHPPLRALPPLPRKSPANEPSPLHGGEEFTARLSQLAQEQSATLAAELPFSTFLFVEAARNMRGHARNSAGFLDQVFDWYGTDGTIFSCGHEVPRYLILDPPPSKAWTPESLQRRTELIGQELPVHLFRQKLRHNALAAFPESAILVHGPQGCGKTTFLEDIFLRATEHFSRQPEAALFGTKIVIPQNLMQMIRGASLGFGSGDRGAKPTFEQDAEGNFVYYSRSNPLFVLDNRSGPAGQPSERERFLKEFLGYRPAGWRGDDGNQKAQPGATYLKEGKRIPVDFNVDYLLLGGLDPVSKSLITALRKAHGNDIAQVWKHIQAFRWSMELNDGKGLVSVRPACAPLSAMVPVADHNSSGRPQLSPDQGGREYEVLGVEVGALRGVLHFADAFKGRDLVNSFSWALSAMEGGTIGVQGPGTMVGVRADMQFLFDENDPFVIATLVKPGAATLAFRRRMTVLTFPLIRTPSGEERLYRLELGSRTIGAHALRALALFAVGTRTMKPNPANYPDRVSKEAKAVIGKLSITEKILLLDGVDPYELNLLRSKGTAFSAPQIKLLRDHIKDIADEYMRGVGEISFAGYDGSQGIDSGTMSKQYLRRLLDHAGDQPLDLITVVEGIKQLLQGGNLHDQLVRAEKDRLLEMFWQKANPSKPIENATAHELEQLRKQTVDKHFLFATGQELVDSIETIMRSVVRRDVHKALGMIDEAEAAKQLARYCVHVMKLGGANITIPEEHRLHARDTEGNLQIVQEFEALYIDIAAQLADNSGASSRPAREQTAVWRGQIGQRIGAYKLDHPEAGLAEIAKEQFSEIYNQIVKKMAEANKAREQDFLKRALEYEAGDPPLKTQLDRSQAQALDRYKEAMVTLRAHGYPDDRKQFLKHLFWAFEGQLPNL